MNHYSQQVIQYTLLFILLLKSDVYEAASLDPIIFESCDSGLDFVFMDWNDIPGATCYDLTITNITSGITTTESGWQNSDYSVLGLSENDEIEIQVTAKSSIPGCESTATTSCTAAACEQYPPLSFNPCEEGDGFITFSWDLIAGITEYTFTNSNDNIPITQTELDFTVTGLEALQTVSVTVQPVHPTTGCSLSPTSFTCTVPCGSIPQMSDISCTDNSVDFVFFEWEDVLGISGYEVTWTINGGMQTTDTIQSSELGFPGELWSNDLNPEEEVSISVSAINADQQCGNSTPFIASCIASSCIQPIFTDPKLIFCWDPLDGPIQFMIGEVTDNNGNPIVGDVKWLSSNVDSLTGLFMPTDTEASATYTISFEWSDRNSPSVCKFIDNLTVQVNILPKPFISLDQATVCLGEVVILQGLESPDTEIVSTFDFDGGIITFGEWPDQLGIVYDTPGMKTITLTETSNEGSPSCTGSISVEIEVIESAELNVSCIGVTNSSLTFGWDALPLALGYNYSIDGGPSILTQETSVTIDGLSGDTPITIEVVGFFDPVFPCETIGTATCIPANTDATFELNGQSIEIYPNPVDKILYIDYSEKIFEVSLMTTKCVALDQKVKDNRLDVRQLPAGVYILIFTHRLTGKRFAERVVVI